MFLGEYRHATDAKGRLTVPARFRSELESGVVVTRGYEPCLVLYPLTEWSRLADKVAQLPMASRVVRSYGRLVFGGAFEVSLDSMGRMLIPAFLREHAGITEEAVVVGLNTHIEIWSPERWQQTFERDSANLDDILAEVTRLGL